MFVVHHEAVLHMQAMRNPGNVLLAASYMARPEGGGPTALERQAERIRQLDEEAKECLAAFVDATTKSVATASAVQLLEVDPQRGKDAWDLARETVPGLEEIHHAEELRKELRARRARLDELIARLGGAFAPRRFHEQLKAKPTKALPPAPQS
jgi:hypothetical protein